MAGVDLPSWLPKGPSGDGPASSNCAPPAKEPAGEPARRSIPERLRVAAAVPGLTGSGLLLAGEFDGPLIGILLREQRVAVAEVRLGPGETLRDSLAEIARALRLPAPAATNLDAFRDLLSELARWWPDDDGITLLLHDAHDLIGADLPGWHTLTDILTEATERLAAMEGEDRRWFETVALVSGYGVRPLAERDHAG